MPITTAECATRHADEVVPHLVRRRLRVLAFQYSVTVGTSVMLTGRWVQIHHVRSVYTTHDSVLQ